MARKLPVETWLRKVAKYASETSDPGTLARVTSYDEADAIESTEPVSLETVQAGEPGHYVHYDSEGDAISECIVNERGERERSRAALRPRQSTPFGAALEKTFAAQLSNLGQQWGDLATYQGSAIKERDQRIKFLEGQLDALKDELQEATLKAETGEGEEWIPVLQQAIDAFAGNGQRERLKQVAIKVIATAVEQGIIDAENVPRLLPLINSEIAEMKTSLTIPGLSS